VKKRTAWILGGGVLALALGTATLGGIVLLVRSGTGGSSSWSNDSYLALDLDGSIPERPAEDLAAFLGDQRPSLRGLVTSLTRAEKDPAVKAVVLQLGSLPGVGWGRVQEIRDAVGRFRRSGKPVYAFVEYLDNKEYYLATAASQIYAVPDALLNVSGLAAHVTFFRGTLDKLGIEAQFEGVGKYKNAPNQFTETGFTPPHREQMEALVDGLFGEYVDAIARGRNKSREEVRQIIDRGPYDGRGALAAGLVDGLMYRDELETKLGSASKTTAARYLRRRKGFGFDRRPKVALVYAVGEIVSGEGGSSAFGGEVAGSDAIARAIRQARTDESVRAVVLRVDSPGGSGTASDVIWREVALTAERKPVVVSMGDMAASGGYYIAMAAHAIVAEPGTITGSIGVFGGKLSLQGLYAKLGMAQETIQRGAHASLFASYRPWNNEEREQMRSLLTAFYHEFVSKAAEGRKKSYEEIHDVAQGRVWTGAQAVKLGLVDRLGGLETAFEVAREKAKIGKGEELQILVLPRQRSFLETLMERQEEGVESRLLDAKARSLLRFAARLSGGGPIARLPFELAVD
jgi:protease-4